MFQLVEQLPSWAERAPSADEVVILSATYASFVEADVWPTYAHVEGRVFSSAYPLELHEVLADAPVGLFWPDPSVGTHFFAEQTLAATLLGLAFVEQAASDLTLFLDVFRWAVMRRLQFVPPPGGPTEQIVPVTDLLDYLRGQNLVTDLTQIDRVLRLAGSNGEANIPSLRGSIEHSDASINLPRELRDYRSVSTLENYFEHKKPRPQRHITAQQQRLGFGVAVDDSLGPPLSQVTILPVSDPVPGAVSKGRGEDSAQAQPAGEEVAPEVAAASLELPPRAASDLEAIADSLGVTPLVAGLADLVNSSTTGLPLTIAITGPWGSGKSSIMRQLEGRLRLEDEQTSQPDRRRWLVARFDAWKYERGERLWAALTKAIYESALHDRGLVSRAVFRTRLEARRSSWPSWLAKLFVPFVPLVVGLVYALTLASTTADGTAAGVVGAAVTAVLASVVAGQKLGGLGSLVSDPFKRAIDLYAFKAPLDAQLGFTSEAAGDVDALSREVTRNKRDALVVFVDDLDRCAPSAVVEVVEAVNQIFNSSRDNQILFVLGMDIEVVAASVEAAYASTIERIADSTRRDQFGRDYLRKIAQLFITVPSPDSTSLLELLDAITNDLSTLEREPGEAAIEGARAEIEAARPTSVAEVSAIGATLEARSATEPQRQAARAALRRARSARFGSNAADVVAAERELVPHLAPTPRALKQFDAAYRLQLHVANESPNCGLSFSYDQLIALGKWVVIRLRWPDLAMALEDDPTLLIALEDPDSDTSPHEAVAHWLQKPGLSRLISETAPARRISNLPLDTFLRIL